MEKEDIILAYLVNQIALLSSLSSQYTNSGTFSQRISFLNLRRKLISFLNGYTSNRLIIMPGLRGVGKTTLLFQLYELSKKITNLPKENILYISCDDINKRLNANLDEVLNVYEKKLIGEPFESYKEKIILLIDEAHYDKKWEIVVKRLFDRSKNILVFVSGSSSISLETSTDTVRRAIMERIFPLNFPEYLLLKYNIFPITNVSKDLRDILFDSKNADEAYKKLIPLSKKIRNKVFTKLSSYQIEVENFLIHGGFPNTLHDSQTITFQKLINTLDKMINNDLPQVYSLSRELLTKIFSILNIMAQAQGSLPYRTLTQDIDRLRISEVSNVMQSLIKAGVIESLNVFSGSAKKVERTSKKYYFTSSSLKAALLFNVGKFSKDSEVMGNLFENTVLNSLAKTKIFTPLVQEISFPESEKKNADFVIKTGSGKTLVMECGWGKKDSSQVKQTMKQVNADYGILINDYEKVIDNILFIPKEIFLFF